MKLFKCGCGSERHNNAVIGAVNAITLSEVAGVCCFQTTCLAFLEATLHAVEVVSKERGCDPDEYFELLVQTARASYESKQEQKN